MNVSKILLADRRIRKLLRRSAKDKYRVRYEELKIEIRNSRVGAQKFTPGREFDFESAIVLLGKCQARLDRLVYMRSVLGETEYHLSRIGDRIEALANEYEIVQKLRPAEVRKSVLSTVTAPIDDVRIQITDLLSDIEQAVWNLKSTYGVLDQQITAAKQVIFMRNPQKFLNK